MIPQNLPMTITDKLAKTKPPEAVEKVREHYARTGEIKMEELTILLGPIKGIDLGPNSKPSWVPQEQEQPA